MHRSTADITTTFDVTGATAVADAMARCADPATCGSEFEADGYASRTVTCSRWRKGGTQRDVAGFVVDLRDAHADCRDRLGAVRGLVGGQP